MAKYFISVDSVSRRDALDSYPRYIARPWRTDGGKPWSTDRLLEKAANAWKVGNGLTGAVVFEPLDEPRPMTYGAYTVLVVIGRVRSVPRLKNGMSRDLSGVVEVRIQNYEVSSNEQ